MFACVRAQKELYQFTSSNFLGDMHVSNACSVRRFVDLCEARTWIRARQKANTRPKVKHNFAHLNRVHSSLSSELFTSIKYSLPRKTRKKIRYVAARWKWIGPSLKSDDSFHSPKSTSHTISNPSSLLYKPACSFTKNKDKNKIYHIISPSFN